MPQRYHAQRTDPPWPDGAVTPRRRRADDALALPGADMGIAIGGMPGMTEILARL
jgi:hypothetical protein